MVFGGGAIPASTFITIMATTADTSASIKQKIFLKEGIPVNRQKIQVYTSFMQDGPSLLEHGVNEGFSSMRVWISAPSSLFDDTPQPKFVYPAESKVGAVKRIELELRKATQDPPYPGCSISKVYDDAFHWVASMMGPEGTPYAGGSFLLDITFPEDYPFKPPRAVFVTKIYHCNVGPNSGRVAGAVNDMIGAQWTPQLSISKVNLFPSSGLCLIVIQY